ncbi:transposon Tf2-6 polyprotein [Trichonephila clavipes]|nr:transposon Tf2-6 polyprotein [Trichonephila clavipes]
MSEGPILHLYKYGRKTELHTDACKQGYGAILLQEAEDGKLHPVYYMSKKTNTAEEKYDSYELEHFRRLCKKKELITRIARWALQLEEFDYEIEHRAGSRMKHVDALSRYPVMMVCNDTLTSKLKKAQEEDDNIQTFKSLLEKQESGEFFERNGILYKYLNGRELIVTPKAMQAELIKLIHENGHFSRFSVLFKIIQHCDEENIQHLQIATGVPRGNGQVERIHRTLIPVLTKLSLDDSTKWYKYVDRLQRILNSTISLSTKWTPFELLVGVKMRNKEDILIKDLLLEEMAKVLLEQRKFLRNDAKKNIETLQSENRKTYNRRRKKASLYKEGDLVAIQRTQFGAGLKLRPKFLGPYILTK